MSTTQINTLRGELLSEIVGVEEAEVLECIKRSIARILSKECAKKEETRPQTKEEIIDQVIHIEPDYNNKSFLRLSKNVADFWNF